MDKKPWYCDYQNSSDLEAQRAYVNAVVSGLEFSASNGAWHWFDRSTNTIYSRRADGFSVSRNVTETVVKEGAKWIEFAPRLTN